MRESFTRSDIVAVLDAAWREGQEQLRYKVMTPKEEQGWSVAIAHLAEKFGVAKAWHDYTPPAEARESI